MAEEYTCIECEELYDDNDGDTDERMCIKCLNDVIKATPEYKLGKKLLNGEISKENKTHIAGDIVYDNPLYDGEPTTADEYNNKWLNENKYNEIKELITDLAWEIDRMSSSGRSTLADLWKIFKIDDKNV